LVKRVLHRVALYHYTDHEKVLIKSFQPKLKIFGIYITQLSVIHVLAVDSIY